MSETIETVMEQLTRLEAEARELHRTVSELRVDAQAQRAGRVEAEHQRDVLVGKVGREVLAALVASIPAKVADVLTGAQRIDEAQQKALDDAVTRAEKAERERDEAVTNANGFEGLWVKARKERDEAVKARGAARAERDAAQARAKDAIERHGRLLTVLEDATSRAVAIMKERDAATAEVARLSAHLTPRPDAGLAGLAGMAARESAPARPPTPRAECLTPFGRLLLEDCGGDMVRLANAVEWASRRAVELTRGDAKRTREAQPGNVEAVTVERKPPFRDWTDEARAKLVPGASVMWHPSWDYGAPRKVIVKAVRLSVGGLPCIDGDGTMGGVALLDNCDPATIEPPTAEETLRQFERGKVSAVEVRERLQLPEVPATIEPPATNERDTTRVYTVTGVDENTVADMAPEVEPPATQAAPVERPTAPSLMTIEETLSEFGKGKMTADEVCERLLLPTVRWTPFEIVDGRVSLGNEATKAPVERPPAPDLRKGDRVKDGNGRWWNVDGAPEFNEAARRWSVAVAGGEADRQWVNWLDLSTRVRTWQPGEVVPYAPLKVRRDVSTSDLIQHGHDALWFCSKPLAEPWTQTGL